MELLLLLFGLPALAVLFLGLTHQYGVYWAGGSAPTLSTRPEITGDTAIESEFTLAAGTVTDQEQQVGFDVANLKGILITVEDNESSTVVLQTNDGAAPDDEFTFPIGGGELFWSNRSPLAIPFSADVETMYFTKSGASEPTVKIRILLNA